MHHVIGACIGLVLTVDNIPLLELEDNPDEYKVEEICNKVVIKGKI